MRVLIVAKTRRGPGACIGAISTTGQSLRLEDSEAEYNESAGLEYEIGEVWEIDGHPAYEVVPPHVENYVVSDKRRLKTIDGVDALINRLMPPSQGGIEQLYQGYTGATGAGALYVSESIGLPTFSTMFWVPDKPLHLDKSGKRLRYRYPTPDGGRTLTYVGFQEPVEVIAEGTLLRISLAHWWKPREKPGEELRCYLQLSGWFHSETIVENATPSLHHNQTTDQISRSKSLEARKTLRQVFGFDRFWPQQEEIVLNLLHGRDTLAIMPTGSGKSLCYQLPSLLFEGLTVVVSPLISLMQDQVDQLRLLNIPAVYLNSTLSHQEYNRTMRRIRKGKVRLLYLAPETLLRPEILVMLDDCRVSCFTIDEAHCISAWGHDFRPDYRQLKDVRKRLQSAVCFALTATATARVRQDIKTQLDMPEAATLISSFDRPNLFLSVQSKTAGFEQLTAILKNYLNESGIIYCSTRKTVEDLTDRLALYGWSVKPYHGGMETADRQRNQSQFVHDKVQIIVATIAFGMGINKPNVRFVIHYNAPENLENYYQQIGRAGRDGLRADCHFLFDPSDLTTIRHFIAQGESSQQAGAKKRLNELVNFVDGRHCRRKRLLKYFGETFSSDNCGMCDYCSDIESVQEKVDLTEAAQKFLSCVVRTGQIFGTNHIIKVLRGSKAKELIERNHDRLSTYNIGREFTAGQWKMLAAQFIDEGLLVRNTNFGGLKLTPAGNKVLQGEKVYLYRPDEKQSIVASIRPRTDDYDVRLFEKLREKRLQLADAIGAPVFVIFSDRSLQEMAKRHPINEEEFAEIHGVGQYKLDKYAGEFLPVIRNYCTDQGFVT